MKRLFVILSALIGAVASGLVVPSLLKAGPDGDESSSSDVPLRRGVVVFVVDASASMRIQDGGDGEVGVARFDAVRREVTQTLAGLRDRGDFLFDILFCGRRIERFSTRTGKPGPVPLNGENENRAKRFLQDHGPSGMTRLYPAVVQGMRLCARADKRYGPGTIFVYTDGIPTYMRGAEGPANNEEFLRRVSAANRSGVKVNAYAVSATSEGRAFLGELCEQNRGILFLR